MRVGPLGIPELAIIVVVILLIFGARRQLLGAPQSLLTFTLVGDVAHDAEHAHRVGVLVVLAESAVADQAP